MTVANSRSFANADNLMVSQVEKNRVRIGAIGVDTDTVHRITVSIIYFITSSPKSILHSH
jgi:hypothetical protein